MPRDLLEAEVLMGYVMKMIAVSLMAKGRCRKNLVGEGRGMGGSEGEEEKKRGK